MSTAATAPHKNDPAIFTTRGTPRPGGAGGGGASLVGISDGVVGSMPSLERGSGSGTTGGA